MQLKKGQIVDLDIYSMAFGGAGIGKHDGLTVFVEGVIPGDKVQASFTRIKSKFADAKLIKIISPSKSRINPKCKYADICGGCQLQHMPYADQIAFKKQHTIDSFERIGKIHCPPVNDVIPCESPFYYRNKMEFSFGYNSEMNFSLGMHLPGRRYDILNIDECHLQSSFSSEILSTVRDFSLSRRWIPYQYSCGKGFLRSLFIREGRRTNEVMINLVTSDDFPMDLDNGLEELKKLLLDLNNSFETKQLITSIYFSQIISRRGQPKKITEKLLYGKRVLHEKMVLKNGDSLDFDILPQAFFQVNTFQAEILYGEILKLVQDRRHEVVFDLFCGTGTIGLFLAKHCEEVLGIELNSDAVDVARKNALKNAIFNIDFYTGDVSKLLKNIKKRPSLIVLDPPRAGLQSEKTIKKVADFDAEKIIYVSCNPATLARDCLWFKDYGYALKSVQPVDMFPHTYHIENVCLLEK